MIKLRAKENFFGRNLLNRILLVLISVILIVWALPRNNSSHFSYEINKPWIYGSFIAKFDFPILKSDAVIKAERDSVLKSFQPYYNFLPEVAQEQIQKFKNEVRQTNGTVDGVLLQQVITVMQRLYAEGIVDPAEWKTLRKDTSSMIKIVNGKEAVTTSVSKVHTTRTAYELLLNDALLSLHAQEVKRLNVSNFIEANLKYDSGRSETERTDLLQGISTARGTILTGQRIIDQGEIVDEQKYQVLQSFEHEMEKRSDSEEKITNTLSGQTLFVSIMVIFFTIYLMLFRREYFRKQRSVLLLYSLLILFPVLVSVQMKNPFFSVYILPITMAPIFARAFMDSRTAFTLHMFIVLISSIAVKYQYEFIIIEMVAGLLAIYSLRELSSRGQVLRTALAVWIGCSAIYLSLHLMRGNTLTELDSQIYVHFFVGSVLLLLAYPLMFIIEKTFGFTSNVTLIELSNTNKGLLRKLSEVAPGTFQHSITVGNLAAAIADRIGANSTLVRTGALYHDIGKMSNPVFFTENQKQVNPHDNLKYDESARIIIGHVTEGIRLAEKNGLPAVIKEFILTHHGQGITKFFYINYQNEHPGEIVDPRPFSYPGPNPQTKEQAILMMADTVEAASRSLKDISDSSIAEHVNRLVDQQVSDGFFKNCPISFRDIEKAKEVLIERLKTIYHTRIEYPTLHTSAEKNEG